MCLLFLSSLCMCFVIKVTCSDFRAGNALRSASRFHTLDETAVFGCACRHEFPLLFINTKHGERYYENWGFRVVLCFESTSVPFRMCTNLMAYRLSYAVWMLLEVLQKVGGKSLEVYVMYDIACTLKKHLQVWQGFIHI